MVAGAVDQEGRPVAVRMPEERALTLYLDKREIVTLMTLGQRPEALALGYLLNQGLLEAAGPVAAVQVDWAAGAAAVTTRDGQGATRCEHLLSGRTVTAGCGQGTQFGDQLERLPVLPAGTRITRSSLLALADRVRRHDTIYKQSGSVHGCALARGADILHYVEDIGRHNAVDSIAGLMALGDAEAGDVRLYTTGRLTSEMLVKAAGMGIPVVMSRSGTTAMGLEVARRCNLTVVGRMRHDRFQVFHGAERIAFDA
ncbi:MAG: formate dehydrogenase accessory sulfurtransferase FdhD [Rhodocyclaceae bacterium]|nr:formate dehydrogenase accessory sulfurtransferase FdhD [Rhodocyclaceae bacterium]